MNACLSCAIETNNPKFCSKSCAASFNNKGKQRFFGVGKTIKDVVFFESCVFCHQQFTKRWSKKFCNFQCQQKYQREQKLLNGTLGNFASKKYLIETNGHKCQSCLMNSWLEQPIPLELEHIDGDYKNNLIENLKLLCPNCHALTPTYKGRNRGNGRHYRRIRYAEGKSY